jgi:hypothetical protein
MLLLLLLLLMLLLLLLSVLLLLVLLLHAGLLDTLRGRAYHFVHGHRPQTQRRADAPAATSDTGGICDAATATNASA